METIWDFVTVGIFAAIIALFLQRAMGEQEDPLPIYAYGIAALFCAITNYLGNHDLAFAAVGGLVATLAYSWIVLKPGRLHR